MTEQVNHRWPVTETGTAPSPTKCYVFTLVLLMCFSPSLFSSHSHFISTNGELFLHIFISFSSFQTSLSLVINASSYVVKSTVFFWMLTVPSFSREFQARGGACAQIKHEQCPQSHICEYNLKHSVSRSFERY